MSLLPAPRPSPLGALPPRSSLAVALALACSLAHAQAAPDAGTLQREAGQAIRALPAQPQPVPQPARPMGEADKAARVMVQSFVIDGATLIAEPELQALLADLRGQALTLAELEQAAQRLAQHYRERGWYVRVYLPVQDVTVGTVRLQVVEGRYGGVKREDAATRADGEFVERMVTGGLAPGLPLPANTLERGLLLANDLAGVRATGVLEAGDTPGSTRLLLRVEDTPFVSGDIGANNHGLKSSGIAQVVGGVALNNLSGRGDRVALRLLATERLHNVLLQYATPLGSAGWSVAAHVSALDYRLGGDFRELDAKGRATTAGLALGYALVRSSERNLALTLAAEQRRYEDESLGETVRRRRIDILSLGLRGDAVDDFGGGGLSRGDLQLSGGRLHLAEVGGDRAADAAGPHSAGGYTKLALELSRLQRLPLAGWQVEATLSGQLADGNLGSAEQFTLGGAYGVRAYPTNEGVGDEGALFKLELQRDLGSGWQAQLFYDAGYIRQHKRTWDGWREGSDQPNAYRLAGAGAGLSWLQATPGRWLKGWRVAAVVAAPLGDNPGESADGRNNDGSRPSRARAWVSVAAAF